MDEIEEKKRKRNEKARLAYKSMRPEEKAELLERRRQSYRQRVAQSRNEIQLGDLTRSVHNTIQTRITQNNTNNNPASMPLPNTTVDVTSSNQVQSSTNASSDCMLQEIVFSDVINAGQPSFRTREENRFSRINSIPMRYWELPSSNQCCFCMAQKFFREPPSFCCSNGEVSLAPLILNQILHDLFTADTSSIGIKFRRRARTYNNNLALTSIGMKTDPNFCWNNHGIYTLKVNGQVTHKLEAFNSSTELPRRLQLFFLDTSDDIDAQMLQKYDLDPDVLDLLLKALTNNPYFQIFKRLRSWDNVENCKVVLRADPNLNQKTHNLPNEQQVAAIWDETSDEPEDMHRDIKVYGANNQPHQILYHYGCYDPLQYPLLFPHGEPGWHAGIERITHSRKGETQCRGQNLVAPCRGDSADDILQVEEQVER